MRVALVMFAVLLFAQPVYAQELTPAEARATRIVAEAQERGVIAIAAEKAPTVTPRPTATELPTATPIPPTATSQPAPTIEPTAHRVEAVTVEPTNAPIVVAQADTAPMWARVIAGVVALAALVLVGSLIRGQVYRR